MANVDEKIEGIIASANQFAEVSRTGLPVAIVGVVSFLLSFVALLFILPGREDQTTLLITAASVTSLLVTLVFVVFQRGGLRVIRREARLERTERAYDRLYKLLERDRLRPDLADARLVAERELRIATLARMLRELEAELYALKFGAAAPELPTENLPEGGAKGLDLASLEDGEFEDLLSEMRRARERVRTGREGS